MLSREEHECLVTQRAERDSALSRERVAFGKNGNERLTKDRHDREPSVPRGKPHESNVQPCRPQPLELLSGCQDLKDEVDVRVSPPERRQHSREYGQFGRCHVADGESPEVAPMRSDCDLDGTIGLGEGAACLDEKQAPGVGEINPPAGSLQQPDSQLRLEATDLLAQRRLSDVKPLRRASEVQRVRDGDEVP
jgi:hypothetical protein